MIGLSGWNIVEKLYTNYIISYDLSQSTEKFGAFGSEILKLYQGTKMPHFSGMIWSSKVQYGPVSPGNGI